MDDLRLHVFLKCRMLIPFLIDHFSCFHYIREIQKEQPIAATSHLRYIRHSLSYGCKASGVKKIRIHDIRHSHASLLVEMGFSPLLIAERLGHERMQTTMETYSHLYPNKQIEVARRLDGITAS